MFNVVFIRNLIFEIHKNIGVVLHLIFRLKFNKLFSRALILLLFYICIINQSLANTKINSESEYFESFLIEAAKNFYNAEVIEPHSVYVNIMAAIVDGGPAHTDNSRFHGRERANTPMWLLRAMLWSDLFDDYEIVQATAIWWLDDVEGGGLYFWPDGPDRPPQHHVEKMANTYTK